jgi:hypothetical protein
MCPDVNRTTDLLETDAANQFCHKICALAIPETYVDEHLLDESCEMVCSSMD